MNWRSGAATDTGLLREHNEDRHWVDRERGVYLVVDGVGGQAAGEVAAQLAVDAIREFTSDHSPVGEVEDAGELSELEAMQHPRRNEVYREVGSAPRHAEDGD